MARDRTWEPTWKEEYWTSVLFHLFWTTQFTAILGTTRRNSEVRFVVKLPFQEDAKPLRDSYHQAKRRLRSLIFRLEKQPDVYNRYNQFIREFIQLGHMEDIPEVPEQFICLTQTVSTSHIIVSSKTPAAQLNSESYLWSSDSVSTWRWRQGFSRGFVGKIQMTEVKTYRMTRVTYWIASSSYHSIRPLKALADSCTNSNLRLAINNDMYVDDLLTGASDVEHAAQLWDEIIATLKTACFDIRKLTSSVSSLDEQLPSSFRKTSDKMIINSNTTHSKHLE